MTAAREMETYHAQRSEAWQDSQRGEAFTELMESVEEIAAALRALKLSGRWGSYWQPARAPLYA